MTDPATPSQPDGPALKMTIEGQEQLFRLGDFTGAETRMFRDMTGQKILTAFFDIDLDLIAGLVWLRARREDKKVTYSSINERLTWDDVQVGHASDADEDEDEESEPVDIVEAMGAGDPE